MSFIFDASKGQTPQSIAQQRRIAEMMLGQIGRPRTIGEGIAAMGNGLIAGMLQRRANQAEEQGRLGASQQMNSILSSASGFSPSQDGFNSMLEGMSASPASVTPSSYAPNTGGGEIEAYIRQSAQERGIDPDTAVKVAMSEGGVTDPFRQSDVVKNGVREESFGPLQLYMGGGLGNEALAAGIDPRKDWKGGVDFGLDHAKQNGWDAWYGAKNVGITGMTGIGNAPQQMPAQQPRGLDLAQMIQASQNPFLDEGQRATLNLMIDRQMKANDPATQLDLRYKQAQIDALGAKDEQWQKLDDNRLFNRSGQIKDVSGGIAPPADFDDTSSLRKEIYQLPSYKNISQALPIYKAMQETAGRNSRASDLNLVYGLGKIMDPNSVVREGEMVMVKDTASIPDWLTGAINSVNGGSALTPETREAIMTEAYGRMQGYQDQFNQDATQYQGIAQRNRMNTADVIPTFGGIQPWTAGAQDSRSRIPDGAAEMLRADPSLANEFDQKYGQGAAQRILGGR